MIESYGNESTFTMIDNAEPFEVIEASQYNHRKTVQLMAVSAVVFIILTTSLLFGSRAHFEKKVQKAINYATEDIKKMILDDDFVRKVIQHADELKLMSMDAIFKIDKDWKNSKVPVFFHEEYLKNDLAMHLFEVQKRHPEFIEIFVTESRGANIAMTNLTSDFYQADEQWWSDVFREGALIISPIEFDISADQWAVPIAGPIRESSGKIVGIIKVLMDIRGLKEDDF